jgi:hypothetical protein
MEGKVTADAVLAALLGGKLPDDELFAGARVEFTDEGQVMMLLRGAHPLDDSTWVEVRARVMNTDNGQDAYVLERARRPQSAYSLPVLVQRGVESAEVA